MRRKWLKDSKVTKPIVSLYLTQHLSAHGALGAKAVAHYKYANNPRMATSKLAWRLGRYEPQPPDTKELQGKPQTQDVAEGICWAKLTDFLNFLSAFKNQK